MRHVQNAGNMWGVEIPDEQTPLAATLLRLLIHADDNPLRNSTAHPSCSASHDSEGTFATYLCKKKAERVACEPLYCGTALRPTMHTASPASNSSTAFILRRRARTTMPFAPEDFSMEVPNPGHEPRLAPLK